MTNREIDALVAQHAMEWKWIPRDDGMGFLLPPDWRQMISKDGRAGWIYTPSCPGTNLIGGFFGKGEIIQKVPNTAPYYSTDPAASKRLRDRMRELGWDFHRMDLGKFRRSIAAKHNGQKWVTACVDDESEEMADALVSLKALGVEIPASPRVPGSLAGEGL